MMLMGPWVVVLVAVLIAVVWALPRRGDGREDAAMEVLDRRLAEGGLTAEEHAQRRQILQEHGGASQSSGRPGTPMAVVATAALVVIVVAWVGVGDWGDGQRMGGHMGWRDDTSATTEVVQGAREVEVEAGELWFEPATVEVRVDEPVNLRLSNTGAAFHDLTVPVADVVLEAEPGEQAVGTIEFAEPGRYEYFCSVPGHARGGMRGTVVVVPST